MPTTESIDRAAARRVAMLETIRVRIDADGYPPSLSELGVVHDVSKRQVKTDLGVLQAAGYIQVAPGVARGIKLLPLEDDADDTAAV